MYIKYEEYIDRSVHIVVTSNWKFIVCKAIFRCYAALVKPILRYFMTNFLYKPVSTVSSVSSELQSFRMLHITHHFVQSSLVKLLLSISLNSADRVSVDHKLLLGLLPIGWRYHVLLASTCHASTS
jgi:hypothetical protein